MTQQKATSDTYAAIAAQLASTQQLIQTLLREIRENSSSQAALQVELKTLRRSVSVLSSIIRDGDGGKRSLVSEVDVLKIADKHHEARLSATARDLEEQVNDLSTSIAKQLEDIRDGIQGAEERRRDEVTASFKLQHAERKDLRTDRRQRLATYATIVVALIALIGSVIAVFTNGAGE